MSRSILYRVLAVGVLALAAGEAGAQSVDVGVAADVQAAPETTAQETADAAADARRFEGRCLQSTGSRIVSRDPKRQNCLSVGGRAYSREDLDSTGRIDTADALRALDPSIR